MAAWLVRGAHRRRRDWEAIGQSGRPSGDGSWHWLASMALVIVALGQPRWGRVLGSGAPAGHDVVLLVNVSRSMAAEDAVPDRMGVAIESAASLLKALEAEPGEPGGGGRLRRSRGVRCPLTSNLEAAVNVLRSLRPGESSPEGPTWARRSIGHRRVRRGGACRWPDHRGFLRRRGPCRLLAPAIDRLREERILVHSVAIGDPDRGHPIPSKRQPTSKPEGESTPRLADPTSPCKAWRKGRGGLLSRSGWPRTIWASCSPNGSSRPPGGAAPSFGSPSDPSDFRHSSSPRSCRPGRFLAGPGPSPRRPPGVPDDDARDDLDRRRTFARNRRPRRSPGVGQRMPPAASPRPSTPSSGPSRSNLGRHPAIRRRFEPLPAPTLPGSRRTLRTGPGAGRPRALDQDRVRPGEHLPRDRRDLRGTHPLRRLPGLDPPRRGLRCGPERRLGQPGVRGDSKEAPRPSKPNPGARPKTSKRPRPSPKGLNKDQGDPDPSNSPHPARPRETPEGGSPTQSGCPRIGRGRRWRTGPPEPGSAEARLDSALKDVQDARRQRPPDSPPPVANGLGKDW